MELVKIEIFYGLDKEKPSMTYNINVTKKEPSKPWLKNKKRKNKK